MGLLDKVKEMLGGRKTQANQGVDDAAKVVDEKTGGSHSDQVTSAADKANEEIDNLGDGS